MVLLARFGFIPYQRAAYHPGPLWPGLRDVTLRNVVPVDNAQVFLAHPAQIILLPLASLARDFHTTWPLCLGGIAWGNLRVAAWEYPLLAAAFLAAACGALYNRPGTWRAPDAGFAAPVLFATFIAVEISQYLTWTEVGYPFINGMNPRYFIPFMPFFIFLLPSVRQGAGIALRQLPETGPIRLAEGWWYLPAMGMALVNVFALPAFIFQIFRIHVFRILAP